jgi:Uri superfamily endonuclease
MTRSAGGLYVVGMTLAAPTGVVVGKLGGLRFAAGLYLYVGSARGGLAPRVARHRRRDKPLRWHIDYLRRRCAFSLAVLFPGRHDECALAARVHREVGGEIPFPRFGASDCHCAGHLIRVPGGLDADATSALLKRIV